ncbi:MAG TPA: hypothetical protein VNH41_04985 [Steroidobacteraceae bacterium]|nr:hypothetical protein [Steroidobacteraceae bacterium]
MSILTRKQECGCEVQYVPVPRAPWLPPREQWGEMCLKHGAEYQELHARAAADHAAAVASEECEHGHVGRGCPACMRDNA